MEIFVKTPVYLFLFFNRGLGVGNPVYFEDLCFEI